MVASAIYRRYYTCTLVLRILVPSGTCNAVRDCTYVFFTALQCTRYFVSCLFYRICTTSGRISYYYTAVRTSTESYKNARMYVLIVYTHTFGTYKIKKWYDIITPGTIFWVLLQYLLYPVRVYVYHTCK